MATRKLSPSDKGVIKEWARSHIEEPFDPDMFYSKVYETRQRKPHSPLSQLDLDEFDDADEDVVCSAIVRVIENYLI